MKMTAEEYEDLMGHLDYLNGKVEACYKVETDVVVRSLREVYRHCIEEPEEEMGGAIII